MTKLSFVATSCSLLAVLAVSSAAHADSAAATCEVRKDGDARKGASGPCNFSQRQGNVSIDLKNGESYNLASTGQANQYKDQGGKPVVRTVSGNTHTYKWNGKKIVVTFLDTPSAQPTTRSAATTPNGQTPTELRDVVGKPASAAEEMMSARGYEFYKSSVSGADVYGSWRNRSTGQCVMVHQVAKKFESIVATGPGDCE